MPWLHRLGASRSMILIFPLHEQALLRSITPVWQIHKQQAQYTFTEHHFPCRARELSPLVAPGTDAHTSFMRRYQIIHSKPLLSPLVATGTDAHTSFMRRYQTIHSKPLLARANSTASGLFNCWLWMNTLAHNKHTCTSCNMPVTNSMLKTCTV